MRKQMSKWLAGMVFTLCLLLGNGIRAEAASGRAYFNDPTVTQGEGVNITMTVEGSDCRLGSADATLVYDASVLEFTGGTGPSGAAVSGGAGSVSISWYDAGGQGSVSFNLSFRAIGTGTTTVQPSYLEVTSVDEEGVFVDINVSSSVNIQAPVTASSEARLSSLQVGPGALNPGFSPDVYEYHTTVAADVERLVVSAAVMDGGANYVISGTRMDPGNNTTRIRVTAADGVTVRDYIIYTVRETAETTPAETTPAETQPEETETSPEATEPGADPLAVAMEGETLQIAQTLEGVEIPEGFEVQAYVYKDREIQAARGLAKPLVLFWMTNGEGNGAFYVYEEAKDSFYRLVNLTMNQKIYTILPAEEGLEIPQGFSETTLAIGTEIVQAWVSEKDMNTNFALVYAMNWNGEKSLYRYDSVEETFQRYVRETLDTPVPEPDASQEAPSNNTDEDERVRKMKEGYESELKKKSWITWALVAFCVVDTALLIFVLLFRRKRSADGDYEESDGEDGYEEEEGDSWDMPKAAPSYGRTRRKARDEETSYMPESFSDSVDEREAEEEPSRMDPPDFSDVPDLVDDLELEEDLGLEDEPEPDSEELFDYEIPLDDEEMMEEEPEEFGYEDGVNMSETAALLRKLEEMERNMKPRPQSRPGESGDEGDEFEFVDLDD
ncbi:MAG: hypothetical protein HFI93_06710 [Lachnospiraceae bacterium]|nr:hypothetical protein [Lachnospiraceae bacterium]